MIKNFMFFFTAFLDVDPKADLIKLLFWSLMDSSRRKILLGLMGATQEERDKNQLSLLNMLVRNGVLLDQKRKRQKRDEKKYYADLQAIMERYRAINPAIINERQLPNGQDPYIAEWDYDTEQACIESLRQALPAAWERFKKVFPGGENMTEGEILAKYCRGKGGPIDAYNFYLLATVPADPALVLDLPHLGIERPVEVPFTADLGGTAEFVLTGEVVTPWRVTVTAGCREQAERLAADRIKALEFECRNAAGRI